MIASELKVYRDTFELTKLILEVVKQFPKLAKYTIGQRAKALIKKIIKNL